MLANSRNPRLFRGLENRSETTIHLYIQDQEKEDQRLDLLNLLELIRHL